VAYPEITAETVDSHINTALGHIETGSYVEARRYIVMAQTAKKAMHRKEVQDDLWTEWDTEIRDVLAAIASLEAAENRAGRKKGLIRTTVSRALR